MSCLVCCIFVTFVTISNADLMAQLDACLSGDQEIASLTLAVLATFFCGDLMMKYFLRSFPFPDSRRAVVSVWRKN